MFIKWKHSDYAKKRDLMVNDIQGMSHIRWKIIFQSNLSSIRGLNKVIVLLLAINSSANFDSNDEIQ